LYKVSVGGRQSKNCPPNHKAYTYFMFLSCESKNTQISISDPKKKHKTLG
jgi:hypothetical protein